MSVIARHLRCEDGARDLLSHYWNVQNVGRRYPPSAYSFRLAVSRVRTLQENSVRVSCRSPLEDTWRSSHTVSNQSGLASNRAASHHRTQSQHRPRVWQGPQLLRSWKGCQSTWQILPTLWHQLSRVTCCWYKTGHPRVSQREGELSVALGRYLAHHPHSIDQSCLTPNRSIVPESGKTGHPRCFCLALTNTVSLSLSLSPSFPRWDCLSHPLSPSLSLSLGISVHLPSRLFFCQ